MSPLTSTTVPSTWVRRSSACVRPAQPHPHPELFAARAARAALHQLAAGPESNYLARLVFPEKTTEFKIEVDLVAEMSVINPFDFFLEPYAENSPSSTPRTCRTN
jgi:hypothetical protein